MTNNINKKPYVRKQAVILIHGIGDQRPMDTLRRFVNSVLGKSRIPNQSSYWSKPDTLSESFELRRLQTVNRRVKTHFYEFYWAHEIQDSKLSDLWSWLKVLLKRRWSDVPQSIRKLWLTTWIIVGLSLTCLTVITMLTLFESLRPDFWPSNMPALPFTVPLLLLSIQAFILAYVGDAARYLSPQPRNISCRHAIRSAGVKLLTRLHKSGEYDRIVVVGHSLGSVIGYDILRHTWHKFNTQHGAPTKTCHKALDRGERFGVELLKSAVSAESNKSDLNKARYTYRNCQRSLWLEQRYQRLPWLVTDFITLGSPLAHAELLMANNASDFEQKKCQRELPLCPPVMEGNPPSRFSYSLDYQDNNGAKRTIRVLHHAACFAVTRWTNLYYPSSWLWKGDFIGGPLAEVFGPGILDVPVSTKAWRGFFSHNFYWQMDNRDASSDDAPIKQLRKALDLDCRDLLTGALDNVSKQLQQDFVLHWQSPDLSTMVKQKTPFGSKLPGQSSKVQTRSESPEIIKKQGVRQPEKTDAPDA